MRRYRPAIAFLLEEGFVESAVSGYRRIREKRFPGIIRIGRNLFVDTVVFHREMERAALSGGVPGVEAGQALAARMS